MKRLDRTTPRSRRRAPRLRCGALSAIGASLLALALGSSGCGGGEGSPGDGGQGGSSAAGAAGAAGDAGSGGSQMAVGGDAGSAGASGNAGSAGDAGSAGGGQMGGADAGLPEPLVVGDVIDGNSSSTLSADAPEGDGRQTACLHVDLLLGEYALVPGDVATEERFEPVMRFVKVEQGFEAFGFFPWNYDFVVPETPVQYLPESAETVLSVYDGDWRLDVAFSVTETSVDMIRVVVADGPNAP